MIIYRVFLVLTVFLFGISIQSCSTVKPTREIATIYTTAKDLNPSVSGRPSPVVVQILQLKSNVAFNKADYFALSDKYADILGQELIDIQRIELQPGKDSNQSLELLPDTKFLGLIAGYRNINKAKWRDVIKIPKKGKRLKLYVSLGAQRLDSYLMSDDYLLVKALERVEAVL